MNKVGPVIDAVLRINGQIVAESVNVTLPELSPQTAEYNGAMGTMDIPITGLFESTETTVTVNGIDEGFAKLIALKSQNLQFSWVQDVLSSGGAAKPAGFKANIRGIPKTIPSIEVTRGESQENEITYETTRYELIADGKTIILFDRLANVLKIDGVDYGKSISDLL